MLFSEFVEGTGCKDNEKNYEVYKNLEIMYMNSNMSKAEIYEYGKKLVDNSKSEAELKVEAEVKEQKSMKNALLWTITSMTAPLGALCIIGMDSEHWLPLFITLMLCILWDTLFVIANKDNLYITTYQIPTADEEEKA